MLCVNGLQRWINKDYSRVAGYKNCNDMTRYKISVYDDIYWDIKTKVRFFEIKNVVLTTFYNQ